MNPVRHKSIAGSMSVAALRVLDGVPKAATWDVSAIKRELLRVGRNLDLRHISGCLNTLVQAGLVIEKPPGMFRQVEVKKKPQNPEKEKTEMAKVAAVEKQPAASTPLSPLDRLGKLSHRVLAMMEGLRELASDIDTAALEIAEEISASDEDMKKLKQLQSILKSLG